MPAFLPSILLPLPSRQPPILKSPLHNPNPIQATLPPLPAIPIPSSLSDAASQAITAANTTPATRLFIQIDLSAGDATYTLLNNTTPLIPLLFPLFPVDIPLTILLPDTGAAALARRDWGPFARENVSVIGLEQMEAGVEGDIMLVVPRASEVELLVKVVEKAKGRVVIVNPDLVDMGVTGLSLNARRLRKRVVDTFQRVYFLKTFGWGVLLRAFPGPWGVWVDDPGSQVGFRLVEQFESMPGAEEIDEVLTEVGGEKPGVFAGLFRFLGTYMKG